MIIYVYILTSCVNMIKDWVAGCCLENSFVAQGGLFENYQKPYFAMVWPSYPNLQSLKTQRMPKSVLPQVSVDADERWD